MDWRSWQCSPMRCACSGAAGVDMGAELPHLHAWLERVLSREAVQRGIRVPEPGWLLSEEAREGLLKGGESPVGCF